MTFWLLEHRNRHAPRGYWGHPSRRKDVRIVVIHTSQNRFDIVGVDTGAENVAGYLDSTDRPASYHTIADSDSTVRLLPLSYTAFGARGYNADAVHVAFAGDARNWGSLSARQTRLRLSRVAAEVAAALTEFGLPAVRLSTRAAQTDGRGVCGHYQLDPDRRTDPGPTFPWGRFMELVEGHMMAFSSHEEDVLKDLVAALDEVGSNGWALKVLVEHVRNHPSGGGLSEADVRRLIAGTELRP